MESFDEDVRQARSTFGEMVYAFVLSAGPALVAALILYLCGMEMTVFLLAMPFIVASLGTILGVFLGHRADWRRTLAYGAVAAVCAAIFLSV